MVKKSVFSAVALISGSAIGAGFLGMPYVVAKAGFSIGVIYLVLMALFVMFVQLSIGEIALRTKGNHQLAGLAGKYLGKKGKIVGCMVMLFAVIGPLTAYLLAQGTSLSQLFFGTAKFEFILTIVFWALMSALGYVGLRAVKKFGKIGFIAILLFIVSLTILLFRNISLENLAYMEASNFFAPFGIVLFSFLSFSSIPAAKRLVIGNERLLKKAIILGVSIPFVVYLLFLLIMIGNFGTDIPPVATMALSEVSLVLGKISIGLGILAIFTSYLALSMTLRDMFRFDFKIKRFNAWLLCILVPLALYLIIKFFNLLTFVDILSITGLISGGLMGILVLIIGLKAKTFGRRTPEYSVPLNKTILYLVSGVFVFGTSMQLFRNQIERGIVNILGRGFAFELFYIILGVIFIIFFSRIVILFMNLFRKIKYILVLYISPRHIPSPKIIKEFFGIDRLTQMQKEIFDKRFRLIMREKAFYKRFKNHLFGN